MNNQELVRVFIDCINARDVEALSVLMSDDHTFIDAHGNELRGKEKLVAGWRAYFEWFPDYKIEINEIFSGKISERGQHFGLFGFAGGSFKGNPQAAWNLPAAWKALVRDGKVVLWQVFADTKIPFEIIHKNNQNNG
jgi:ketosteroid isomerase-like protein